jgi:S1-C subfamily serine protease
MEESQPVPENRWRRGWQRLRTGLLRSLPFFAGMLAVFLALLLYRALYPAPQQMTARQMNDTIAQVMASATPPPPFSERVYQQIQPSIILVEAKLPAKDGKDDGSLGTGVILDDSGDILTSLHVVAQATEIQVIFADGTKSSAQVTVKQPEIDIAVLRADNPPAQIIPAVLGNPHAMQVGDEVFAVGNPFGLYSSMSAGVISGFDRSFEPPDSGQTLQGMIQIDAAVNPGNSGGPLLNRYGQVIGIVTGIVNPVGENFFVGIGFAVPINVAGGALGSPPD